MSIYKVLQNLINTIALFYKGFSDQAKNVSKFAQNKNNSFDRPMDKNCLNYL